MDYKSTLNMPKSGFPMRAGLPKREPEMLKHWEEMDLYNLMLKKNEGKPRFALHDGPPFSNGGLHMGHALNKSLKDFITRSYAMRGYYTPYIPGWDNHGMPIESAIIKQNKLNHKAMPVSAFRSACHEFAQHYIDVQMEGFKRIGVLGDWEHPYKTMDPGFEAEEVKVFGEMYKKGYIYKGLKPVYWCYHDETALAEAEIEYQDDPCTTVYVKFPMNDDLGKLSHLDKSKLNFVIWTTTIWTLPGNLAIALHPDESYAVVKNEDNGEMYIVAEALVEKVMAVGKIEHYSIVETHPGNFYENMLAQHPFLPKTSRMVLADYVTMDSGTGCVHNAPGFCADDYQTCRRYGMDMVVPVNDQGRHTDYAGKYEGMLVEESNPVILNDMKEAGTLFASEEIVHSYPHCWRCKHPVLFRATDQWFVSMDKTGLREQAGKEIRENVKWYPAHAANRIGAMVEQRPDWCISRQRNWGVPIPSYTCADCGEKVMNDATLDAVIKLFHEKGSDAWFTDAPESYLGEACVCPKCGGHHLKADKDILDVWWDSGVSWKAVCEYRPELEYPADVYLEGSDQHRGWFQSSLLTSVGANGHAPYKAVVSQGFTLDGQGRKMSKSLGNVIDPNKVCDEMGADIIRLWVASVDTSSDVSIDHEILARTSDAYRRFRNTLRFLLSELEGQFEPETDGVAFADLLPLDKLMVARLTQVQAEVDDAYASYEFPRAYRALYDFVVTELSNVYLDALKDRLYCDKPGSLERRSAQTVLAELFSMLMRDLQPILSYTVDEAMAYAPAGCVDHQKYAALLDWYKSPITVDEANEFEGVLEASLELRSAVTKALEDARSAGTFTKSQQVRVKAVVPAEMYALLTGDKAVDLAEFYIVSDVELTQGEELSVAIEAAEGECCDRCWNYRTTVGEYNGHAHICKRCANAL